MADSAVYTRGTGATYPLNDFCSTTPLVSRVISDNGIGGSTTVRYRYEGATVHRQGLLPPWDTIKTATGWK